MTGLSNSFFPNIIIFFTFFPCCLIQDKACDAMEIFDELVESEVSIVTPHVKTLIEFCLQVCDLLNVLFTVC